jgi:hypothetical protein
MAMGLTGKIVKILSLGLGRQLFRRLFLSHQWIRFLLWWLLHNFLLLLYVVL